MVAAVARCAQVETVLCVTESGQGFEQVCESGLRARLIAATPNEQTHHRLQSAGWESLHIPARILSRFKQAQHTVSVALEEEKIAPGELVAVAIGQGLPGYGGDFLLVMDVQPEIGQLALRELVSVPDHVRPDVLDSVLEVACRIGRAAKRGKRVGAMLVIGEVQDVLAGARQLVPNPFHGYGNQSRDVSDPEIHQMLVELAKLDGAFVINDEGFIVTAAAYLAPGEAPVEVSSGLGSRHVAAARLTKRILATAVVVSATDGNVRVFSDGTLILQIDPEGHLPEQI